MGRSDSGCHHARLHRQAATPPRQGQGSIKKRAIAAMCDAHLHPPAFIARSTVPRNWRAPAVRLRDSP